MILVLSLTFFTTQVPAYELQKKYIAGDAKFLIHLDFKAMIKTRLWDNIYKKKKIKIHNRNDHFLKEVSFDVLKISILSRSMVSIKGTKMQLF